MAISWDINDSTSNFQKPEKPFWELPHDDDPFNPEIHEWLMGELNYLKDENSNRIDRIERNICRFKGIQYKEQLPNLSRTSPGTDKKASKNPVEKIVVNHIFDFVKNRVSRAMRFQPGIQILPKNDEFSDKNYARMTKAFLDHIWYIHNYQRTIRAKWKRLVEICGEGYLFITWNAAAGDLHPAYKQLGKDVKVPLLDDNGNPKLDDNGNQILINKPVYVGEVDYTIVHPMDIYLQQVYQYEDIKYLFRRTVMDTNELKLRYKNRIDVLNNNEVAMVYDFDNMEYKNVEGKTEVWTLYYKRTDEVPDGRLIVFTENGILRNVKLPYDQIPCVRWIGEDWGDLYGHSFIENVSSIQGMHNNLQNLVLRNEIMAAHPKWIYQQGSIDETRLGNEISLVPFKGNIAPVLVQCNPTPQEIFVNLDRLENAMQKLAGVLGVSRGEPPAGVKAGVAIQFLDQQESDRFNEDVAIQAEVDKLVAIQTISVCRDNYDESDGRTYRIMGKNNEWITEFFDVKALDRDYDIRIQNSSALPETKAARVQTILDIKEMFPNLVPDEQALEMLDLGQSEKLIDTATLSVKAAEAENEMIMQGIQISEPVEYEDLTQHWRVHLRLAREWRFKNQAPNEVKDILINHLRGTEYLMIDKAKRSPAYARLLDTLVEFPTVFRLPPEITNPQPTIPMSPIVPAEQAVMKPENELEIQPQVPELDAQIQENQPLPQQTLPQDEVK